MARLVLHIGTKKTGSTLIQALLAQNRDRLSSTGWSYPDFLQRRNHSEFALMFQPRITETHQHIGLDSAEAIADRRREIDRQLKKLVTKQSNWIISSEYLSSRLINDERVADAVDFLRNHFDHIDVVVALRRQEFVLPSVFSQKVKLGAQITWSQSFCDRHRKSIDCEEIVARWARVVGRESISAIPYLEEKKREPRWLIDQFANASGIPIDESWTIPARSDANRSLSAEGVAYLRLFDPYLPRWLPDGTSNLRLRRQAVKRLAELTPGPPFTPSQAELARIEDTYWDSNVALVESMPPTADWAAWLAQSARDEKTPLAVPEIEVSRAVELMVAMSQPAGPLAWGYPGAKPPTPKPTGLRGRLRARRGEVVAN
ncbi:MAG: hypothetical protein WC054_04285 [Candidatus Nanopelagicales bacterium]